MSPSSTQSERFLEWNEKMIRESAKMIKLVLILLIGWTFITIGWIVHLILVESGGNSSRTPAYLRFTRAVDDSFDQLEFYTVINHEIEGEQDWKRIKTLIGGLHRLKEDSGKVPSLTIYTKTPLDGEKRTESLPWNKINFKIISNSNALIPSNGPPVDKYYNNRIWISNEYTFDPIVLDLKKADLLGETEAYKAAFSKGRRIIESIGSEECLNITDNLTGKVVLRTPCIKSGNKSVRTMYASQFGLKRIENASKELECHVDLKGEVIENGAELVNFSDFYELENISRRTRKKKVAIAVPTTSKGMQEGEQHVLLGTMIPSLNSTILSTESKKFEIILFIGFDKGDEYFEVNHEMMKEEIESFGFKVIFLRLAPFKRIAMTWNMIFHFARKHVRFDYYYQVNDDLKMVTPGWLTKFTGALDKSYGIGVAGPSDKFNGFACSLLTQAFVSDRHFQIFSGKLYPLEFRDWKSDRWLSFVYGPNRTYCWQEIEANNGAKGTRYEACPFSEWKIILERGREVVKRAGI